MRNIKKFPLVFIAMIFAFIPFSDIRANATSFDSGIPSFGLYSENENGILHGSVKYVVDGDGKAVQYSQYSVSGGTYFLPFVCSAFNMPEIETDLECEICYGAAIGLNDDYEYKFYSSSLNSMTGTVYTLGATNESFTVKFGMLENQNCICRFPQSVTVMRSGKNFALTVDDAQTDIPYEVFIINGDCVSFESAAKVSKETITVKDYIDRNFATFKDYYAVGGEIATDLLYSLANYAVANDKNYDFFDFFIDSVSALRLNGCKFEVQSPCTITYSMPVEVQKSGADTPAIYTIEQTATGNYPIDYTIELNGEFPCVLECSAKTEKQGELTYAANAVAEDFYFVFGSSEKSDGESVKPIIILGVLSGVIICGVAAASVFAILRRRKH